jgi:hypothetical protein
MALNQMGNTNAGGKWWNCMTASFSNLTSNLQGQIAVALYPTYILGFMAGYCVYEKYK